MLPFALKIAWFLLSLTGLLSCWVTLWAFGRVVRTKWASVVYCVGTTFAQGIFCLGIVYRMDPFLMDGPFCLVQNAFMSAGGFINMGVILAFTVSTSMAVRKPKTWGDAHRALRWQKFFCLPVIVLPVLATTSYLSFSFSFRSIIPSDGLSCDATEPVWVRLLGPYGIPFLLSTPVLYLSIQSCLRIRRINLHLLRSRPEPATFTSALPRTGAEQRTARRKPSRVVAVMPPIRLALTISKKASVMSMGLWKRKCAASPDAAPTGPEDLGDGYGRPPTPLPLALLRSSSVSSIDGSVGDVEDGMGGTYDITLEDRRRSAFRDGEDRTSTLSSAFPTFAKDKIPVNPSSESRTNPTKGGGHLPAGAPTIRTFRISVMDVDEGDHMRPGSASGSKRSNSHTIDLVDERRHDEKTMVVADVESVLPMEVDLDEAEDESIMMVKRKRVASSMIFNLDGPYKKPKQQPARLAPALWHVILFQFGFVFIQFLAFLTTFVDVTRGRQTPSPFGSQYLALLLAAWCPVVVFGSIPVVRRNLIPWHPISNS